MIRRTPGPWRVEGPSGNMGEAEFIAAPDKDIAWTCNSWDDDMGQEITTEEDKANAAFIVEACNSHDTLRSENARLREALAAIVNPTTTEDGLECCSCAKCMDAIDNARALAAGKDDRE